MALLLANLLLALTWVGLTGSFSAGGLAVGFVVGYIALYATQGRKTGSSYFGRVAYAASFAGFYLKELLVANWRMAQVVTHPRPVIHPGVIGVPLNCQTDAEITLLANLITLTPGTLTLDVSSDRKILYVHAMDIADRRGFCRFVKDLEARVTGLLQPLEARR